MHHAITVGGLLWSIGVIVGIGMAAFGALMAFAAGMSDARDDGTGSQGCILFVVGLLTIALCVVGLLV